jgi:Uma2 family endonuclease
MRSETAKRQASYEDLCALPDNVTGEIIDGELVATPRPKARHVMASSMLGAGLAGPFGAGKGGPGGWWILDEPELHLAKDVLVPDIAGWKKKRMPELPDSHIFDLAPDWVCEVLSPNTIRTDRIKKLPKYAKAAVPHLWTVDPANRTLDVFKLESGRWLLVSSHVEDDKARAEPFDAVELDLSLLWA